MRWHNRCLMSKTSGYFAGPWRSLVKRKGLRDLVEWLLFQNVAGRIVILIFSGHFRCGRDRFVRRQSAADDLRSRIDED